MLEVFTTIEVFLWRRTDKLISQDWMKAAQK